MIDVPFDCSGYLTSACFFFFVFIYSYVNAKTYSKSSCIQMHRYRNFEHMLNLPLKVSKDFCKDSALHMTIVSFIGLK